MAPWINLKNTAVKGKKMYKMWSIVQQCLLV